MNTSASVDNYAAWVERLINEHWQAWMITFMFNELHASEAGTIAIMEENARSFYSKLLTRIVRKPNNFFSRNLQPILIGCPDFPVFKHEKPTGKLSLTNGGLHFGGIILLPYLSYTNSTRLKEQLDEHVEKRSSTYCSKSSRIDRIHLKLIDHNPDEACKYVLKAFENKRITSDEILILPKSITEI